MLNSSVLIDVTRKTYADAGPGIWRACGLYRSISTYFSLHCLTYKISTIVL
jgi:hypothetical protein